MTALPQRTWDPRLDARGVAILPANAQPGQEVWIAVKGRWLDKAESAGRHHIFIETLLPFGLRALGVPLLVTWPDGGEHRILSEKVEGEWSCDFPMSPSLSEFSIRVDDGQPSETITGIGMGIDGNPGEHSSTAITFQRSIASDATDPIPLPPVPPADTLTARAHLDEIIRHALAAKELS